MIGYDNNINKYIKYFMTKLVMDNEKGKKGKFKYLYFIYYHIWGDNINKILSK